MKKIYSLIVFITILIATEILFSCKTNNLIPTFINDKPKPSTSADSGPLDKALTEELNPYAMTSGCFSVITYNPKTQEINSIKEYSTTDNGILDIIIKNNESFIISLPTYSTVTYSWKITNTIDNTFFKLDQTSSVHLKKGNQSSDTPLDEIRIGEGYDRQNFYFSTIKTGSQNINFECSSDACKSTDNFKINLNIQIL